MNKNIYLSKFTWISPPETLIHPYTMDTLKLHTLFILVVVINATGGSEPAVTFVHSYFMHLTSEKMSPLP